MTIRIARWIEAKNIYGHLWALDRASILDAMNQAVSRLRVYDSQELKAAEGGDVVARNAVFHGLSPQTVGTTA